MSVLFIREPSETPNIQNLDDIRMVRYAYGNQNGYIKGYGAELSHNATGSTFLINSGIFVVQGAEVRVDANGWSESVSGVTNKRYYTVYGEVNLALQTAEIKSTYSHTTYPTIEAGDDLTQSTDGTARVLLYRFTATNSIIADVQKSIQPIKYSVELVADEVANRTTALGELQAKIENGTLKAKIAEYASANVEKGTIEERLTSLGFRQGGVTLASGITATRNSIKRQGNYVILDLQISGYYAIQNTYQIGSVPSAFLPDTTVNLPVGYNIYAITSGAAVINTTDAYFTITTSGNISLTITGVNQGASHLEHIRTISGYVASPL